MGEAWNRVYDSDSRFFGEEPTSFAMLCFGDMRANNERGYWRLGPVMAGIRCFLLPKAFR
jgi:hypothetical protein